MANQESSRRPGFRAGIEVRLADGHVWTLPIGSGPAGPGPGDADDPGPVDPALVAAIAEAEDQAEQRLGELALAIHLLRQNYRLGTDELYALLDLPRDSPAQREAQEAFHAAACHYATPPRTAENAPGDPGWKGFVQGLVRVLTLSAFRRDAPTHLS